MKYQNFINKKAIAMKNKSLLGLSLLLSAYYYFKVKYFKGRFTFTM